MRQIKIKHAAPHQAQGQLQTAGVVPGIEIHNLDTVISYEHLNVLLSLRIESAAQISRHTMTYA